MKTEEIDQFTSNLRAAMEKSIMHHISSGSWIMPDYANRIKLPPALISDVWAMVELDGIKKALAERVERELADRIVNHMAAEIATDIKQILSVPERREAIRALARQHIESLKPSP